MGAFIVRPLEEKNGLAKFVDDVVILPHGPVH